MTAKNKIQKTNSEVTLGSFWDEINSIKNWSYITLAQINKIDLRRLSVFEILNSKSFSKQQDSKYCKMFMSKITEEKSKASINHHSERVAGWQRECPLSENEMLDKPFEVIKRFSSNRGRLIIIKIWEKITIHPNSVYQSVLKDLYGASKSKNRSKLSKKQSYNISNIIYRKIQSKQLGYIYKVKKRKLKIQPKIRRKVIEIADR